MKIDVPVRKDIQELDAIRSQTRWWSYGSIIAVVAILTFGTLTVANGVQGLFQPGPTQDQFASALGEKLNHNVVPGVQTIVSQALTESQPAVEAQFTKLNGRLPEVSGAFMQQFDLLQKDLPERGDKVLQATFGQTLQNQEPKIRQMFPDATEQNVSDLVDNVTNEAGTQIQSANSTLFAKHQQALMAIMADLNKIQSTETINPDEDKANLDMAISVIDTFHSDLTTLDTNGASAKASKEKKQ